jgi:phosphate transport system permease protein
LSSIQSPLDLSHRQRSNTGWLRWLDRLTYGAALGGALTTVALLVLILGVLCKGAWPAIHQFGWSFLYTTPWGNKKGEYGILPAIYGTLTTSGVALIVSLPVSIGSAIFLTKLAPKIRLPMPIWRRAQEETENGGATSTQIKVLPNSTRNSVQFQWINPRPLVTVTSFLIELLAAIPSIVYGLWGIAVLIPLMQDHAMPVISATLGHLPLIGWMFQSVEGSPGSNLLTAGVVLSIMVTPIMTAIIRDVIAVAPPELEQGALGLGATWWQATRLVLGFSKMGIFGAVILGFARAIGETMAVAMVVGDAKSMDSLLGPGRTITSLLANKFSDNPSTAIYAAFVLLVITTAINGAARIMVMRAAAKAKRK